jgi:hypothetical protein
MFASYSRKMHALPSDNLYLRKLLPSNSPCLRKAFVFAFEETLILHRRTFSIEGSLPSKCLCDRRAFLPSKSLRLRMAFAIEGALLQSALAFAIEELLPLPGLFLEANAPHI